MPALVASFYATALAAKLTGAAAGAHRRGPARRCKPTPGPATCASCATCWSAPPSSRRPASRST
ncbi:MAG: hypothetical protein WKG07_49260 [Hymenobacter sp.]